MIKFTLQAAIDAQTPSSTAMVTNKIDFSNVSTDSQSSDSHDTLEETTKKPSDIATWMVVVRFGKHLRESKRKGESGAGIQKKLPSRGPTLGVSQRADIHQPFSLYCRSYLGDLH